MSKQVPRQVNWQPISSLPFIASMIDGMAGEAEQQHANLEGCRSKPYVLDDTTVERLLKVFVEQAEYLPIYEEQLSRWKDLTLDPPQRREVERLAAQLPKLRERIASILTLAQELKQGTIESVLAKSDIELGMDSLLKRR